MNKDVENIIDANKNIYSSGNFFNSKRKRDVLKLPIYKMAYDMIMKLSPEKYLNIFEFGVGGGEFLKQIALIYKSKNIYGYDIFENIIEENKEFYKNYENIKWIYHNNLSNYLNNNKTKYENTLFIGMWVFENMSPDELYQFFDVIKSIKNIYLFFASTTINSAFINGKYEVRESNTHFEYNYLKILDDNNFKIIDMIKSSPKELVKKHLPIYHDNKYETYYILCTNN